MSSAAGKHTPDKPKTSDSISDKSAAFLLFATAASTTWRMFVPTLGGTLIGLWLDAQLNTTPWIGIGGLAFGIVVTAVLIKQQYKQVDK